MLHRTHNVYGGLHRIEYEDEGRQRYTPVTKRVHPQTGIYYEPNRLSNIYSHYRSELTSGYKQQHNNHRLCSSRENSTPNELESI